MNSAPLDFKAEKKCELWLGGRLELPKIPIVKTQGEEQSQRQSEHGDRKCGKASDYIYQLRRESAVREPDRLAGENSDAPVEVRVRAINPPNQQNALDRKGYENDNKE